MAERAMRNEVVQDKEAIKAEKEALLREKESLVREKEVVLVRFRFSQRCCTGLQATIKGVVEEKNKIFMVLLCLIDLVVEIVFGIVLKLK